MRIRLTSPAKAELAAALEWYCDIQPSLAARFLADYEALLIQLSDNPRQFQVVRQAVRRARFQRFPYGLLYRIQPAEVEIIACFHSRRDPRRWQDRL